MLCCTAKLGIGLSFSFLMSFRSLKCISIRSIHTNLQRLLYSKWIYKINSNAYCVRSFVVFSFRIWSTNDHTFNWIAKSAKARLKADGVNWMNSGVNMAMMSLAKDCERFSPGSLSLSPNSLHQPNTLYIAPGIVVWQRGGPSSANSISSIHECLTRFVQVRSGWWSDRGSLMPQRGSVYIRPGETEIG